MRYQGPPSGVDARAAGGLVQPAQKTLEVTVVDRSLPKKETKSLSADVSVLGATYASPSASLPASSRLRRRCLRRRAGR